MSGLTWPKLLWAQFVIGSIVGIGIYTINSNLEKACRKVVAVDINHDGHVDLVTLTCKKDPEIEIYLNRGDGEFLVYQPTVSRLYGKDKDKFNLERIEDLFLKKDKKN